MQADSRRDLLRSKSHGARNQHGIQACCSGTSILRRRERTRRRQRCECDTEEKASADERRELVEEVGAHHPVILEHSNTKGNLRITSRETNGRKGPRIRYSTVTDFARLRGWSTSQPRRTAM